VWPHMTVRENVGYGLRMQKMPAAERERRVDAILRATKLQELAARYPGELSGGQQQRVALARGLVFDPDVVLLDEPLGALDKNLREQMQVEIKRIHRELGITMIYVTHDQTEAMTMSDRVAVFNGGRIEQLGSPLEVYNRPVSRFVAEFIGDSNILPGTIDPARPGVIDLAGIGAMRVAGTAIPTGEVDLMIRPERLRLRHNGTAADANQLEMTVDDIINYGDSVLAIGKAQGTPLRARLPGALPDNLQPGSVLQLAWSAADAHVLARR